MEGSPVPHPSRGVLRYAAWRDADRTHTGLRTDCEESRALSSTDVFSARGARTEWMVWMQDRDVACNQANPMIGCRVQQTCTAREEQAAEVVRNDKGGTSPGIGILGPKARNEAAVVEKAKARTTACPASWTPRLAGTVANPE